MENIITLTTDFGLKDPYVGAMKGVILTINPDAKLVDIAHLVSPQNIIEGALILAQSYQYFPKGTIHLAVIDPGVGGERKPIVIESERYLFVGPDNGLFSLIYEKERITRIIHLTEENYFLKGVSTTFHGRDIFAPIAAHLSLGVDPAAIGKPVNTILTLHIPEPSIDEVGIDGEVIYVDSFGNLITNIRKEDLVRLQENRHLEVLLKNERISGITKTYSVGKDGEPVAVIGSSNLLEIACNLGSAAEVLQVKEGISVRVKVLGSEKE